MRQAAGLRAVPSPRRIPHTRPARFVRRALAVAIAAAFGGPSAYAQLPTLPTDPQVVNGTATINTANGEMTITNSDNAVINWGSFSIDYQNRVRFNQDSVDSKVLNRVIGNDPSRIFGSLSSNGSVWLINPNGVLFGAGAQIDVRGLVASTLGLSNEDFLAGRYRFEGGSQPNAEVVNQAGINTSFGGHVWLVGTSVRNDEGIGSEGGTVVLAAGTSVELVDSGVPNITVRVTATNEGVVNMGTIVADGGGVDLHAGIVNQRGFIRANNLGGGAGIEITGRDGVSLAAGSSTLANGDPESSGASGGDVWVESERGYVQVAGTVSAASGLAEGGRLTLRGAGLDVDSAARLDVSGIDGGGTMTLDSTSGTALVYGELSAVSGRGVGGALNLSGSRIGLDGTARLLASGEAGGGRVAIESAPPASLGAVYIGPGARVEANSTGFGRGGSVTLGASGATRIHGTVEAVNTIGEGGGGSVRTYGRFLDVNTMDLTIGGLEGTGAWTVEAGNLDIRADPDTPGLAAPDFSIPDAAATSRLSSSLLSDVLTDGVGIDIRAGYTGGATPVPTGNITVSDSIIPTNDSLGGSLALRANHDIVVSENVAIDSGSMRIPMRLIADADTFGGGGIRLLPGSRLRSNDGDIQLGGGSGGSSPAAEISLDGATINAGSGRISLTATNTLFNGASLSSSASETAIVMRTATFSNTNSTLTTTGNEGRWLMQMTGPLAEFSPTALGNLDYDFVQVGVEDVEDAFPFNNGILFAAPLDVRITLDAARPYDGTTRADYTRALASDLPAAFRLVRTNSDAPGLGRFDTPNAGQGKPIAHLAEADFFDVMTTNDVPLYGARQYYFGDITPKPVSYTLTAADKVYDATRAASVTGTLVGLIEGDSVDLQGLSGLFDTKNVGIAKTVTASATLGGADAANYVLAGPVTTAASIAPRALAIGIGGEVRRQYDASTAAALDPAQYLLDGLLGGDLVTIAGPAEGSYDSANVGQGKTVTVSGPFQIAGADAFNYSVNGYALANVAANTVEATVTGNVGVVTPAILAYRADAAVRETGTPITGLGGTVIGFKGEDSLESATTGSLSWSTPATPASAPGNYAITGGGLSATNYAFVQDPGNAGALVLRAPAPVPAPTPEPVPEPTPAPVPPPLAAPQQAQQNSTASLVASVAAALPLPETRAGSVLDISSPAAGKTFGAIRIGTMNRQELAQLLAERRDFKRKLFADAIYKLEIDPSLADLRPCATVVEAGTGSCRITKAQLDAIHAAQPGARPAAPKAHPNRVASLPQIERKIAVLFGINDYADKTIPRLENAVPDVDAVARLFGDKLGYEVRVLHNPTKADMIRTLNALSTEINSSDSVVVYYAGHGYSLEKNGAGYWLPSDALASDPRQWVSNSDVAKLLSGIRSKQMALVSDSCYSGAFAREGMDAVGRNVNADEVLSKRSVVVISSGGDEPVADEGKDNHSIFAWNLMKAVDGVANWKPGSSVFTEVQTAVKKEFPQTPHYGAMTAAGHQSGGDYLFELRTN